MSRNVNDTDAFAEYVSEKLHEFGPDWMVYFILEHAWDAVSEEFNNDWCDYCNEEKDTDNEDEEEEE